MEARESAGAEYAGEAKFWKPRGEEQPTLNITDALNRKFKSSYTSMLILCSRI